MEGRGGEWRGESGGVDVRGGAWRVKSKRWVRFDCHAYGWRYPCLLSRGCRSKRKPKGPRTQILGPNYIVLTVFGDP